MKNQIKEYIAWRCAQELNSGIVNLGIGIPTLVANYISTGSITLHSENGILGVGPSPDKGEEDINIVNASKKPITALPHASYFDSSTSFGIMRGGHLDTTVIGALQVSEQGDIASWAIPGKDVLGVGGAMDLVIGAKRVIATMTHLTRDGAPKFLRECTYPLTAKKRVDTIITEFAVFKYKDNCFWLIEKSDDITLEQLKEITPAYYQFSGDLKIFNREKLLNLVFS